MVSKRSDFYASHVGRSQLALMRRCYPGGYPKLVALLRQKLDLPPLSDQAVRAAVATEKANCHVPAGATVFSSEDISAGNIQRRKSRVASSQKCAANAAALKAANKAGEGQHLDAALDNHGRAEKDAQSKASVEMPRYDRAGSNHRRSEGEATMHLKTPSRRKKARPGAAKASPSSRCLTCKKRGVSSNFLATQQHYKRGKTETCEAVQRAWSAGGSRSSPGAESETVP